MGKRGTRCELCGAAAAVHCAADSAFLCLRCDAKVHGANFLASRHQRRRLRLVGAPAASSGLSGASSASSESSCSCVSTADSAESAAAPTVAGRKQRRSSRHRPRAEAVLEGWAERMGFAPGVPARRRAASAARALRALGRGVAASRVPLRVAMAAALWAEITSSSATANATAGACKGAEAALLRRLEAAAHVPARLVLTVASWMARASATAASRRPAPPAAAEEEEGWAECS